MTLQLEIAKMLWRVYEYGLPESPGRMAERIMQVIEKEQIDGE